ncbi:MAG: hypothetical protein GY799_12245 [Desulfobulbaceae bacterium]|nr:hypothetical protein [Desulfobulbaceae bacterium]
MSTKVEILNALAAMIPNLSDRGVVSPEHYKGDMDVNNGSLLQLEGVTQVSIVADGDKPDDNYTQEIQNEFSFTIQYYYRVPTDEKIEELAWEYTLLQAAIEDAISKTWLNCNSKGIPNTLELSQLLGTSAFRDIEGFEKADKYGIARERDYTIKYTTRLAE